jgi:ATP-dependent RNA helicase DDX51/DBP6
MYPRAVNGSYKWDTQFLPSTFTFSSACLPLSLRLYHIHQFLKVIDEADRLLAQSFQDWLAQVLAATRPTQSHAARHHSTLESTTTASERCELCSSTMPYADGLAPTFLHLHTESDFRTDIDDRKESSCQKLLFSATLTRDPSKVAALNLRDPKYFIVQGHQTMDFAMEKFTMPATLTVSSEQSNHHYQVISYLHRST